MDNLLEILKSVFTESEGFEVEAESCNRIWIKRWTPRLNKFYVVFNASTNVSDEYKIWYFYLTLSEGYNKVEFRIPDGNERLSYITLFKERYLEFSNVKENLNSIRASILRLKNDSEVEVRDWKLKKMIGLNNGE
jgi:hypothetical protein